MISYPLPMQFGRLLHCTTGDSSLSLGHGTVPVSTSPDLFSLFTLLSHPVVDQQLEVRRLGLGRDLSGLSTLFGDDSPVLGVCSGSGTHRWRAAQGAVSNSFHCMR
ncbi:hypothetical protein HRR83_008284 [Exophiala dermatitidis]|uniref:Uncharacterized protein n=1 Tax=Exophiala dermatitidis TaxID=5970 RepID=A0AAN6IRL9_EXODE|nr:hypothetical protein HRR73_007927 [Exophiala dermatitidis]KAJ4507700.1 hypothetical protein HRR74_008028 [Exophiala dermatitidis]KAJ4532997.1 hypothetical protein HRR76_007967 [Exophiala dermatitidis]KAJ4535272.1 hypothetical protein HRR77_008183 [Exophiala dermatitidis]KAJ4560722.1 hypothetical protein HRR79_007845 [Exophiala dermatitidis]